MVGVWSKARAGLVAFLLVAASGAVVACEPEVGSDDWCQDLKDKPKGDWTANEAVDFAKHCVL